ncbi:DUF6228 family protein [Streptomyces amakusaensis]|uniref:DUF6228 family protein n=1 Tax=Streptomyces amakusaensis TaxID=67271 RepID=A0ABW0ATL5_9ACTN
MTDPYRDNTNNTDGTAGVTLRFREGSAARVRLLDRFRFDAERVEYAVELRAPGMSARVDGVVAWTLEAGLPGFLEELAAGYRGWEGERRWETEDRDLVVSAVFRSRGRIGLTWTLRPWREADGGWSASVTTWLEAGEQMAALAADVRHFLTGEPEQEN